MSTSDILELLIEKDNGYLITSKAVESGVSKPSVSKYVTCSAYIPCMTGSMWIS